MITCETTNCDVHPSYSFYCSDCDTYLCSNCVENHTHDSGNTCCYPGCNELVVEGLTPKCLECGRLMCSDHVYPCDNGCGALCSSCKQTHNCFSSSEIETSSSSSLNGDDGGNTSGGNTGGTISDKSYKITGATGHW